MASPDSVSTTDIAWAAGFFDGEGWAGIFKNRQYHQPRMSVAQCGDHAPALLKRFQAAVGGGGRIWGPITRPGKWKLYYAWQLCSRSEVERVANILWPYLGPYKREQIEKMWQEATPILRHKKKKEMVHSGNDSSDTRQ